MDSESHMADLPKKAAQWGTASLTSASRYAAQRRAGFKSLRFAPDLETEYREYRLPILRQRLATLFRIASFGLFGYLLIGTLMSSVKLTPLSVGFIMAAVSITILMVFVNRWADHAQSLDTNVALGIAAFGLCIVASILSTPARVPIGSVFVTLIATYFVSGIPMRKAALAALSITAAYVIGRMSTPGGVDESFVYTLLFLALINAVGLFGEYQIENEARRTFLLQMELRDLAQHDGLTRLLNRRSFRRQLQVLWRQAEREQKPIGLMLLDLDHLKRINDTFGHAVGDHCIEALAAILRRRVQRPLDIAGRLGGDEFVGAWFDVDPDWFRAVGEAVRNDVDRAASVDRNLPHFTVSIGSIHVQPGTPWSVADALKRADENLYAAKHGSRNLMRYSRL
jgi:diguanylate cyclase (GGDEF)-like protein